MWFWNLHHFFKKNVGIELNFRWNSHKFPRVSSVWVEAVRLKRKAICNRFELGKWQLLTIRNVKSRLTLKRTDFDEQQYNSFFFQFDLNLCRKKTCLFLFILVVVFQLSFCAVPTKKKRLPFNLFSHSFRTRSHRDRHSAA